MTVAEQLHGRSSLRGNSATDQPTATWLRPFAAVALISAMGLMVLAWAAHLARTRAGGAGPVYWVGLSLVYGAPAARLVARRSGRTESGCLVLLAGLGLYLVKVIHSPRALTFTDEVQQLRSLLDLASSNHLFSDNPLVSAYAVYPGLTICVDALRQLAGIDEHAAGLLIIGLCRAILVLGLLLLLRGELGSTWLAGIGVAVYASNPNFVYFGAELGYESLALPLALMVVLATRTAATAPAPVGRGWRALVTVLTFSVVVTHHMTALFLLGLLGLWWLLSFWPTRTGSTHRRAVGFSLTVTVVLLSTWMATVAAGPTLQELGPVFRGAAASVLDVVRGNGLGKVPFRAGSSGPAQPVWEQLTGFASVGLLLALLPAGVLGAWRRHREQPFMLALLLLGAIYPVTLALRLVQAGTEISSRTSEFVFLGLAALVPLAVQSLARRLTGAAHAVVATVTAGLLILFLGGIIIGWAPYARLPGPFLVEAGPRSIDPIGVAAARWSGERLEPRGRLITNGANRTLFGSYGGLDPQSGVIRDTDVPEAFFALTFRPAAYDVVVGNRIRYIVTDRRLTEQPSQTGTYFFRNERGAYGRNDPLDPATMGKFAAVPGLDRVYDNGDIAVYDAGALVRRARAQEATQR